MPSIPQNLSVVLQNSSLLVIAWESPEFPNGVVSFQVNITSSDLATGVETSLGELLVQNSSNRFVELALGMEAFVRYGVSVSAKTIAGESEAVTGSITTAEGGIMSYRK